MTRDELKTLRARTADRPVQELLDVFDAAVSWVNDWDDTKPGQHTIERQLFDLVKSTQP